MPMSTGRTRSASRSGADLRGLVDRLRQARGGIRGRGPVIVGVGPQEREHGAIEGGHAVAQVAHAAGERLELAAASSARSARRISGAAHGHDAGRGEAPITSTKPTTSHALMGMPLALDRFFGAGIFVDLGTHEIPEEMSGLYAQAPADCDLRLKNSKSLGRAPRRNLSQAAAAPRPSLIAQTTRLWPRRQSPAANTPFRLVT